MTSPKCLENSLIPTFQIDLKLKPSSSELCIRRMFNLYLSKSVSVSFAQEVVSSFIFVFQGRVQHEIQAIVKFIKIDLVFTFFLVFNFFFSFSSFLRLRRITNYIFCIVFLTYSEYTATIVSLEVQDVLWISRCWSLR